MGACRVSKKIFKVGLVGTGVYSAKHVAALSKVKGAVLAGVVGSNYDKSLSFAKRFKTKAYSSYQELLADEQIDVVDLVIPPGYQERYALLAAEAGKHVLLSKPMATNVSTAKEIVAACDRNNVVLSVIFPRRSEKIIRKVKNIVRDGCIGEIVSVNAALRWHRDPAATITSNWANKKNIAGGGVLTNQAIHLLDLLIWIVGDVDRVMARYTSSDPQLEIENSCAATLGFKNGAVGTFLATTAVISGFPDILEIHGTKGSICVQGSRIEQYSRLSENRLLSKARKISNWLAGWLPCKIFSGLRPGYFSVPLLATHLLQRHLDDVFCNLASGASTVSGAEGIKSLQVIEAMYRSGDTNKEVILK